MIDNQKVLSEIRMKGPVLPHQIAKIIGTNILLASAVLSQLVSEKHVKASSVKIGGSPLYYIPGQEFKLEQYSDRLHEKEKKAFSLLKDKKLVYNEDLEPVMKVAMSKIKDFSKPINVKFRNQDHLFWKWHTFSTADARPLIREILNKKFKVEKKEPEPVKVVEKTVEASPQIKKIEKIEEKKEEKKETKEELKSVQVPEPSSAFLKKALNIFENDKVTVLNVETVSKNKEFDLILAVPSSVGSIKFYCKAKDKKKINDSDLSSAFAQGQLNKLPVLFITKGDLTKKAEKMLNNEFSSIIYKKIS